MNLLSYVDGSVFTGAKIKEWALETSKSLNDPTKVAISKWVLSHYYTLKDERNYMKSTKYRSDDKNMVRVPTFIRI